MSSGDEYDAEPMYTDMLEDVCDRIHSHPRMNRREVHYNIRDSFKQWQAKWNGVSLSTRNMGKCLHKVFKAVVNEISKQLLILVEPGSECFYFIPESRNFAEVTKLSEDTRKPC